MGLSLIPFAFVIAMIVATVGLGMWATRAARTASDFFVAGRSVNVFWNASAISGEYLSAASFLGVAGLIMKHGYDALWYPVGYAFGYLFLLLFIAGPLRRFGAYTIPDFAEGRFDSPAFRKIAVIFVLCIGFFYTMPQMKGAGLTMGTILGWPYWVGIAVVGGVITLNVSLGGMKGITIVQAFQYWAKAFAIALPVFVVMSVTGGYDKNLGEIAAVPSAAPQFAKETTVKYPGKDKAPGNAAAFSSLGETAMQFPKEATIEKISSAAKLKEGNTLPPVLFNADGTPLNQTATGLSILAGTTLISRPAPALSTNNDASAGNPIVAPKIEFATPAEVTFPSGAYVPNAQNNQKWLDPYGTLTAKHGYPLLYTFSLIIALVCGTAGLPHILVRFYTNPDGRSAKRTTFWVMVLLGVFYVFTPVWGTLGRADLPELLANSKTDTVLINLPKLLGGTLGEVMAGITSAGAFAAFMSTFSGLLVSMSGAFAHDVYGKILRPTATNAERLNAFRIAAVLVGVVSMGLGLLVETFDIALLVNWAFAIAAASYFPLLLLGSWWRGLTATGAAVGMLLGGTCSLGAILVFMLLDKKVLDFAVSPLTKALLEQPAIWGVPFSLGLMILVSLVTKHQVPKDIHAKMLRLHAPEEMGLSKDYIEH